MNLNLCQDIEILEKELYNRKQFLQLYGDEYIFSKRGPYNPVLEFLREFIKQELLESKQYPDESLFEYLSDKYINDEYSLYMDQNKDKYYKHKLCIKNKQDWHLTQVLSTNAFYFVVAGFGSCFILRKRLNNNYLKL